LQNWDEQAVGAYYTNRSLPTTTVESYYFLKKEVHDILPVTNPQFQPDRHVNTLGARVVQTIGARTDWVSEYSCQWGAQHGDSSILAWGGYSYMSSILSTGPPLPQSWLWALSGDNPRTRNRIENWDPLFSQWPEWSDMYVYTPVEGKSESPIGRTSRCRKSKAV